MHTFLAVVKNYRLPSWAFYSSIASLWTFNYVLGMVGPLRHGKEFFVRANAWVSFFNPVAYDHSLTRMAVLDQCRVQVPTCLASLSLDLHFHVRHDLDLHVDILLPSQRLTSDS